MITDAQIQAELLAAALNEKGFPSVVHRTGGHQEHPCIKVKSGRWSLTETTAHVYVAPNDGVWVFWWSTLNPFVMVPLVPALEVSTAAGMVSRAVAGITGAGLRVL